MSDPSGPPNVTLGPLTRRPAVSVVLLLAAGILLHVRLRENFGTLLVVTAIVAMIAAFSFHRRVAGAVSLSLLILLLGIGIARREHFQFSDSDIGMFAGDEPHLAEVEVRLLDDPQIIAGPSIGQRMLPPKQTATAEMRQIKSWSGWIPATGQLPIAIEQIQPALRAGQTVRMLGMLERPRVAMNPGEFDWAWYYRQQRILATFTVTRAGNIHILSDPGPSAIGWLRAKARHLLAMGFTTSHATDYELLDALLLGDRDPQLRDIEQQFQQTGMGYQLAVSGLHIALLAAVAFWLCRFFRLRPRWTLAITTGFVLVYATITLPSHSGIRAAILCIVAVIALCGGRSSDRAQFLSLAAIAMLLWHPMDLYSAGFHLSFAVVIVFVLLLPRVQEWVKQRRDPDEIAASQDMKRSPAQQFRDAAIAWVIRGAEYSVLAWLATLPLVAYHFGQASSWAILGSLLLLPVVMLSLFAGMGKLLVTLLWPGWAAMWAMVAGWPVEWMQWGVRQLARLPGSSVTLAAPPMWLVVVYYLLLIAPLMPHRWWVGRRRWILRLAPLAGVVAIFGPSLLPQRQSPSGDLTMTLLSLGAGQCAVVEPPGGLPVLFDAGSTTVADVAKKIVEPFLRAEGQSRVDEIFLSHGDFDHISAAGEITADYSVRELFTSWHFIRNAAGNIPDQMLLDELEKLNRTPIQISTGDHFDLGQGTAVDVLWPPKDGDLNSNNAGLVLRLTYAGRSILFPADIQDPAFAGVLKNASALKSDVLVAPHHGSSEDLTPAFLAAVQPQMILSSNFGRLTNKQKRFETMVGRTPLYRTPECGAITVTIHKDGTISVSTFVKNAKPK
jgi:competence protein ComEC